MSGTVENGSLFPKRQIHGALTIPADTLAHLTDTERAVLNVRMTYGAAGERIRTLHNVTINPIVVFTTTAVTLTLQDSQGTPITDGVSWEYRVGCSGAWQPATSPLELLPISNLNVRANFGTNGGSMSTVRNIAVNPTIIFTTTRLTVAKRGTGTVLVNGQICDAACEELSIPFTDRTVVTLEASAEPGSMFVQWENDVGDPLRGIVYEETDVTIYAVFINIE